MRSHPPEQRRGPFATKPTDVLVRETEEKGQSLKRVVGLGDLTALGLGAIIGTGIFVVIGEAIASSGPVDHLLVRPGRHHVRVLGALLRRALVEHPGRGQRLHVRVRDMGELVAWIIGWDLILEYGVSVAAVAVGWGEYLNSAARHTVFGITLPESISAPPGDGGTVNVPAVVIVLAIWAAVYGLRETARANSVMVIIKIAALLMFIALGITAFDQRQLHALLRRRGRGLRRRR
jgi:APA family basic amino acid/polyamine antiporter